MPKLKGLIWLSDTSRYAGVVTYHRGVSGASHKFVWVEKHQAHIYEGRELDLPEFNKVALEIFGSRDATYHKPIARLVEVEVELIGAEQLAGEPAPAADATAEPVGSVASIVAEREAAEARVRDLEAKVAELVEHKLQLEQQSIQFQAEAEQLKADALARAELPAPAVTVDVQALEADVARLKKENEELSAALLAKAAPSPRKTRAAAPAKAG